MKTAPSQSPNVEYDVIEDEPEVYCEDVKKLLPASDCMKKGELYYSIKFLNDLCASAQEMLDTAEMLNDHIDKFYRDGCFDFKKIEFFFGNIAFESAFIRDFFAKIDIIQGKKK